MMYSENEYRYTEVAGVKSIELPYANGAFAMKVIIPQSPFYTLNTESLFTIDKALYEGKKSLVKLAFPSFKIKSETLLTDALKEMGIKRVFTSESQLNKISDAKVLYVDKVLQQAVIATDCKGTSAAAVTMIALETSASPEDGIMPIELSVNQPFYFLIEEKSTGTILFVGHVSKL